jgi:Protein of unknown function (DUF3276)
VEFNKRRFNFTNNEDKDSNPNKNREDRGFSRDRDNNGGGGFRERSFGNNRDNRDGDRFRRDDNGGGGGGFRERSFGNNRGGGGGFRKDFNREDRPARPQHELVHTSKFRAGKRRTYFFDVRKTENGDHYLNVTESTQRMNGGYDRHKVFLYKEDFNRFVRELTAVVEHIKTELQPDYDYDEFERRQLEWEEQRRLELENGEAEVQDIDEDVNDESEEENDDEETVVDEPTKPIVAAQPKPKVERSTTHEPMEKPTSPPLSEDDEDMSW